MQTLHPLLDADKQDLARRYEREKRRLSLAESLFSGLTLLLFYLYAATPLVQSLFPQNRTLNFIAYIWIFLLAQAPVTLFFGWLSSFRHEHAYGFSTQSFGLWLLDQLKAYLLALLLMPFLLGLLAAVLTLYPQSWWLIGAGMMILVSLVFATLFPVVILPLFNRYTPIEDENLVFALRQVLEEYGIRIKGFYVQDMSRQTRKENAFLAGLGKTRRVVLADTILENMTIEELRTVIAHEVGHTRHRHILKNISIMAGEQVFLFYLLDRILPLMAPDFLSSWSQNLTVLPLFLLSLSLLSSFLLAPLTQAVSRYFETQADETALEATGDPQAFMRAMAGLANRNLSNAYPERWNKILFYSHPPVGERLALAQDYEKKQQR